MSTEIPLDLGLSEENSAKSEHSVSDSTLEKKSTVRKIKGFYSSLTNRKLVSSFLGLQLVDIAMTNTDLTIFHGKEANYLGGAELMNGLGAETTEFIKLGISALIIGAYILSSMHEKEFQILKSKIKPKYVMERSLQGITAFMTGAILWDSLNLSIDMISHVKF